MADLREIVGSLGYDGVATSIRSGNVTFTAVPRHVVAAGAGRPWSVGSED